MDKLTWFTSSYSSGNGACVECARTQDGGMAVRDSKHPTGPALALAGDTWRQFLATIRKDLSRLSKRWVRSISRSMRRPGWWDGRSCPDTRSGIPA